MTGIIPTLHPPPDELMWKRFNSGAFFAGTEGKAYAVVTTGYRALGWIYPKPEGWVLVDSSQLFPRTSRETPTTIQTPQEASTALLVLLRLKGRLKA